MKWRLIILSIYILSLACSPCTDAKSSDISTVLLIKQQGFSKHTGTDICTPFCICNCCGSPILYSYKSNNVSFEKLAVILQHKASEYQSAFASSFLANIWQPPKL